MLMSHHEDNDDDTNVVDINKLMGGMTNNYASKINTRDLQNEIKHSETKIFRCQECLFSCSSKNGLLAHSRIHSKNSGKNKKGKKNVNNEADDNGDGGNICKGCKKTYKYYKSFISHQETCKKLKKWQKDKSDEASKLDEILNNASNEGLFFDDAGLLSNPNNNKPPLKINFGSPDSPKLGLKVLDDNQDKKSSPAKKPTKKLVGNTPDNNPNNKIASLDINNDTLIFNTPKPKKSKNATLLIKDDDNLEDINIITQPKINPNNYDEANDDDITDDDEDDNGDSDDNSGVNDGDKNVVIIGNPDDDDNGRDDNNNPSNLVVPRNLNQLKTLSKTSKVGEMMNNVRKKTNNPNPNEINRPNPIPTSNKMSQDEEIKQLKQKLLQMMMIQTQQTQQPIQQPVQEVKFSPLTQEPNVNINNPTINNSNRRPVDHSANLDANFNANTKSNNISNTENTTRKRIKWLKEDKIPNLYRKADIRSEKIIPYPNEQNPMAQKLDNYFKFHKLL